jgi:glycine oxidase
MPIFLKLTTNWRAGCGKSASPVRREGQSYFVPTPIALYDAASRLGEGSAAWAAAGMITPAAEAVSADAEIVAMGRHSLSLWPQWLAQLPQPVFFRDTGTLLLWHREDAGESSYFEKMLTARDPRTNLLRIDATRLEESEPALGRRFQQALYLSGEAQVDNRALLMVLAAALEEARVRCYWQAPMLMMRCPTQELL